MATRWFTQTLAPAPGTYLTSNVPAPATDAVGLTAPGGQSAFAWWTFTPGVASWPTELAAWSVSVNSESGAQFSLSILFTRLTSAGALVANISPSSPLASGSVTTTASTGDATDLMGLRVQFNNEDLSPNVLYVLCAGSRYDSVLAGPPPVPYFGAGLRL